MDREENKAYAEYAEVALSAYTAVTDPRKNGTDEENISDLMADLMHLALQKGLDVEALVNLAVFNYEEEINEEDVG